MTQKLTTNVFVADVDDEGTVRGGGTFYGPDYPENKVTAAVLAKITNPAAFEESDAPIDPHSPEAAELRAQAEADARSGDVGAYTDEELADLSKAELQAIATARGLDVPSRASKDDLLEALTAE